jgi:hypothetical protein
MRSFLQDHPGALVQAWRLTERLLRMLAKGFRRLGPDRSSRLVGLIEEPIKRFLFDCRMCGQCVLHHTGMTCPMSCPKQLRNGPCGGVCLDGKCEVKMEMDCVWLKAVERAAFTPWAEDIHLLNPPADWRLHGRSSWVTFALEADRVSFGGDPTVPSAADIVRGPAEP